MPWVFVAALFFSFADRRLNGLGRFLRTTLLFLTSRLSNSPNFVGKVHAQHQEKDHTISVLSSKSKILFYFFFLLCSVLGSTMLLSWVLSFVPKRKKIHIPSHLPNGKVCLLPRKGSYDLCLEFGVRCPFFPLWPFGMCPWLDDAAKLRSKTNLYPITYLPGRHLGSTYPRPTSPPNPFQKPTLRVSKPLKPTWIQHFLHLRPHFAF